MTQYKIIHFTVPLRLSLSAFTQALLFDAVVQVSSRIWVLWGLILQAPEATSSGGVRLGKAGPQLGMYSLYFAWGVTEVLRYSFFAVKVQPYHQMSCLSRAQHCSTLPQM